MRTLVATAVVLAACAGSTGAGHDVTVAADPPPETTPDPEPRVFASREPAAPERRSVGEIVAAGRHVRLTTERGPIHVWIPDGYQRKRARTIVYVHGLYTDVDGAWKNHNLASQFAASALNAMFIACEAPVRGNDPIAWPSLAELLRTVEAELGKPVPRNRVVAVGHSGAWKTIVNWLAEPTLDTVVLLDAMYGEVARYHDWFRGDDSRRLIVVGDASTRKWTEELHAKLPDALVLDGFPPVDERIPRSIRRAPVVYIRSDVGHFPLVTDGVALPLTLRTLRGKLLLDTPLADLIGAP